MDIAAFRTRERPAWTGHGGQGASWNAFVRRAPGGDLVQTTAWGGSKRALGLRTCLVVVNDPGGTILGGALIIVKRFAPRLSVASVARGPLVARDDGILAERVVDRVLDVARTAGARLAIVQPPEGCPEVERALAGRGFELGCPSIAPEATIRLDLRRSEEELLAAMSGMRRRNLRRPRSSEVAVEASDDVALFWRLHACTAARQGFRPLDEQTLRAQWDALSPSGACWMMVARYEGEPLCAIWLTSFAGTVTFRIAGWDHDAAERAGAPKMMNDVLHWAAMRRARASGAQTHDLGGFDRRAAEILAAGEALPEGFRSTPAYFKHAFGGRVVVLPRARWGVLGGLGALGRPMIRRALASPRVMERAARARNG